MPYTWSPETERALLLAAIQEADLKPSKQVWANVATALGGGLTAGAVSQKFAKIKTAATTTGHLAPTTPAKKPTASKANGSGTGGRKRRKADTEESTNGTEVKMENADQTKVKMENGEETPEDVETPSKKVKVGDGEAAGTTNGVNGENGNTDSADGSEKGEEAENGMNGVNGVKSSDGANGANGANGVGEHDV